MRREAQAARVSSTHQHRTVIPIVQVVGLLLILLVPLPFVEAGEGHDAVAAADEPTEGRLLGGLNASTRG